MVASTLPASEEPRLFQLRTDVPESLGDVVFVVDLAEQEVVHEPLTGLALYVRPGTSNGRQSAPTTSA